MVYKIGSFNLHNLGEKVAFKKNGRNLKKIAEIIKTENFDIVALQEVCNEGKAFTDLSRHSILYELGENYGFISKSIDKKEGSAFLWNKKRFEFFTDSNEYFDGAEIKMLEILKQKGIVREPFFGRFIPQNKQNFELRLINVHNFRGGERKGISRRRSELSVLLQEIYPIFSEIETNIPSYTILMGDYNLELVRYDDELKKIQ